MAGHQSSSGDLLLTILHISDLHVGELDSVSGDAALGNAEVRLYANVPWFDGVLGHHARGLEDLHHFYWDLVEKRGKPLLIVSGDLTRMGAGAEFDLVDRFVEGEIDLQPPHQRWVGLHDPNWREHRIPGNHDHWPGRPWVFGNATQGFTARFPAGSLPYVRDHRLPNGRLLKLVGLNTDADVPPRGPHRLAAVGLFQSQLADAAARLGRAADDEIRVLVMHHSWHPSGSISIAQGSRAALEQFLVSHRIQVMLTGHLHVPFVSTFVARHRGAQQRVLECRCGTTTKVDQVPYAWRNVLGRLPQRCWPQNALLVHSLYGSGNSVRWTVETFLRTPHRGFDLVPGTQAAVDL